MNAIQKNVYYVSRFPLRIASNKSFLASMETMVHSSRAVESGDCGMRGLSKEMSLHTNKRAVFFFFFFAVMRWLAEIVPLEEWPMRTRSAAAPPDRPQATNGSNSGFASFPSRATAGCLSTRSASAKIKLKKNVIFFCILYSKHHFAFPSTNFFHC